MSDVPSDPLPSDESDACEHGVPLVDYCRTCEQIMPTGRGSVRVSIDVDVSQAVASLEAAKDFAESLETSVTPPASGQEATR